MGLDPGGPAGGVAPNDTHRPRVLPIPGHAGRRRLGSPRPSCWLASGVTLHVLSGSAGATRREEGGSESYRGQEPRAQESVSVQVGFWGQASRGLRAGSWRGWPAFSVFSGSRIFICREVHGA